MFEKLREELTGLCRLCYDRGHVAAANGNISVRAPEDVGLLIKASGTSFAFLSAEDILFVDWEGRAFECADMSPSRRRPSMELGMHAGLYLTRGDAGAVVHLHSPYATALSCRHPEELPLVVAEARHILGRVPVIPAHKAGSQELAEAVRGAFSDPAVSAAALMEHGSVAIGKTLRGAYNAADMLEHNAKVAAIKKLLEK